MIMGLSPALPRLVAIGTVGTVASAGISSVPSDDSVASSYIRTASTSAALVGGGYLIESGVKGWNRARAFEGVGRMFLGEEVVSTALRMHQGKAAAGLGLILGASAAALLSAR
jgi:hypothetical protein